MELKLAKLPDRTPVKITITASPDLNRKLALYTELYNAHYLGSEETVADLIPFMLADFLDADRNFAKAFKEREANGAAEPRQPAQPARRRRSAPNQESNSVTATKE